VSQKAYYKGGLEAENENYPYFDQKVILLFKSEIKMRISNQN
jgi:hypothetical protein